MSEPKFLFELISEAPGMKWHFYDDGRAVRVSDSPRDKKLVTSTVDWRWNDGIIQWKYDGEPWDSNMFWPPATDAYASYLAKLVLE